jgi:uncharacterized protein (TIGR02246 family)
MGYLAWTVLTMLLVGAAAAAPQDAAVPADARATIAAANADWIASLKAGTPETSADPYAEDGMFVTATGSVVTGREAIRQLLKTRFEGAGRVTDATLVQDGLTLQGPFIYEWGHATIVFVRDGGATVRSSGRYLTVWKKSATGRWEIVRNLSLPY